MAFEDDLLLQQERLRVVEDHWNKGMKLIEDNLIRIENTLKDIDNWESELDDIRATVDPKEYSRLKALAKQQRQQNYALRQESYNGKAEYQKRKVEMEKARQEIQRVSMRHEAMRYK
jgi:hypothetical protein